jgi:hypothetical protein
VNEVDEEQELDTEALVAFSQVFDALKLLPEDRQKRILKAVAILLGIE